MSIKCNLIIDGNYLMNKDVFILQKTRTIGEDLVLLMRKDVDKLISTYSFNNIYFVSDKGSSWRKEIYPDYKGNREKDESIDWNSVYKDYDLFKEEISKNNRIQLIQHTGLEGDDIIGYIVKESNKKGYSNIIVASDSDLQQLLDFSIEKEYINIIWNYRFNDEKIFLPKNYQIFTNHMINNTDSGDLFDLNYDGDFIKMLENIINRTKSKEVDNIECLFKKILSGDAKDNIKSVAKIKDKELNENGQGIGDTGAEKCYQLYKDTYNDTLIDFRSELFLEQATEIAAFYKKVNNRSDIKHVIKEKIKFNHKLLVLDGSEIPTKYKEYLKNNIIFK